MKLMHAIPVVVLVATSGLLAGCGTNDDETAAKNIKASILKEQVAGADLTGRQAGCLADNIVDKIGVDQLKKYGLLDKDLKVDDKLTDVKLKKDDADAMAASFTGCVDAEGLIEKQFSQAASGMSDKQQQCIKDVLTKDRVEKILSLTFQGKSSQIQEDLRPDLVKCIQPSS
ncbi:hypothetical protein [Nocardioides marmoribigeumensis]|uniref:Propanediol dehydratase large subunit n=1 Tax=Nocardioides marmoribigeumensis TaxID=433649 RepID=A0ABU2BVS4_9ACTN|nr:hypothetical protein [Nocardioides marmoribigeumensis]MDR7362725.1 propanediol dehydratase large subunit [Nocardioides marmoribigeumensis]